MLGKRVTVGLVERCHVYNRLVSKALNLNYFDRADLRHRKSCFELLRHTKKIVNDAETRVHDGFCAGKWKYLIPGSALVTRGLNSPSYIRVRLDLQVPNASTIE